MVTVDYLTEKTFLGVIPTIKSYMLKGLNLDKVTIITLTHNCYPGVSRMVKLAKGSFRVKSPDSEKGSRITISDLLEICREYCHKGQ